MNRVEVIHDGHRYQVRHDDEQVTTDGFGEAVKVARRMRKELHLPVYLEGSDGEWRRLPLK